MDLFEKIDLFEKMAVGSLANDSEVIDTLEDSKYSELLTRVEQFSKQSNQG